jgi:hypothetical protein
MPPRSEFRFHIRHMPRDRPIRRPPPPWFRRPRRPHPLRSRRSSLPHPSPNPRVAPRTSPQPKPRLDRRTVAKDTPPPTPQGGAVDARKGSADGQEVGSSGVGTAKSPTRAHGNAAAANYSGLVMKKLSRMHCQRLGDRGAVIVRFTAGLTAERDHGPSTARPWHWSMPLRPPPPPTEGDGSFSFEFSSPCPCTRHSDTMCRLGVRSCSWFKTPQPLDSAFPRPSS